jgi:hypothetical protein
MHTRLAALAILASCALAPSTAEAQNTDPAAFWGVTIGVGVPMLAVDAILVAEAIDKALGEGYGLYRPGAIFELVWGALHVAGVAVAIGVSTLAYDPAPLALAFGVPLAVVGAYFIAHGIWSLTPRSSPHGAFSVSLVPSPDGIQMMLFGTL